MKKRILKIWKEYKSLLFIIVFTLCLIFIGAPIFHFIATGKWSMVFIDCHNYDTWITYYGAVIGGSLTLCGVWWTIKCENKSRKNEIAIQYKPYITLLPYVCVKNDVKIEDVVTKKDHSFSFYLLYKNIGNGESNDTTIKIIHNNKEIDIKNEAEVCIYPDLIHHNLKFTLEEESINFSNGGPMFDIIFEYTDILRVYQYRMHYIIRYYLISGQCTDYTVSILHDDCKATKIINSKKNGDN